MPFAGSQDEEAGEVPRSSEVCSAEAEMAEASSSSEAEAEEYRRAWVEEDRGIERPKRRPDEARQRLPVFRPQYRDRRQRSFVLDKVFLT